MTTFINWKFLQKFQPLPVGDRRMLVQNLMAADVDHRDPEAFYGWLLNSYVEGLMDEICQTMEKQWKHERRHPATCLRNWLRQNIGAECAGLLDYEAALVMARERLNGADTILLDELALIELIFFQLVTTKANDTWVATVDLQDEGHGLSSSVESVKDVLGDPNSIVDRVALALGSLRDHPDPVLLCEALALADAIETHVDLIMGRAALADLIHTAETALATLPEEIRVRLPSSVPDAKQALDKLPAAVAELDKALAQVTEAEAAWMQAMKTPASRTTAMDAISQAEAARDLALEQISELWITNAVPADAGAPAEPATEGATDQAIVAESLQTTQLNDELKPSQVLDVNIGDEIEISVNAAQLPQTNVEESCEIEQEMAIQTIKVEPASQFVLVDKDAAGPTPHDLDLDPTTHIAAPDLANDWDSWISQAQAGGRLALAVHLADGRDLAGATTAASVPAAALEGALIGRTVERSWDGASRAYEERGTALLAAVDSALAPAPALVLAAGALRPALLLSETGLTVLRRLPYDVLSAPLHALAQAFDAFRTAGASDLAEISALPDNAEAQRRRDAAIEQLRNWLEEASQRTTNFGRATAVWRAMAASSGSIGAVVKALLDGDSKAADAARDLIAKISSDPDGLFTAADAEVSFRYKSEPIEGQARKQMLGFLEAAVDRIRAFLDVQETPAARPDRHKARRSAVIQALMVTIEAARPLRQTRDATSRAAADLFVTAAETLVETLEGRVPPSLPLNWTETLDFELALLPMFPLDARLDLRIVTIDDALALATAAAGLSERVPTPEEAFSAAMQQGATSSGRRLIPHLPQEQRATAATAIDDMVRKQRRELGEQAEALRLLLDDYQAALTDADPLPEQLEREMVAFEPEAIARLPGAEGTIGGMQDFPSARASLAQIAQRLVAARDDLAEKLRAGITALEDRLKIPLGDCRAMMAGGDLATLSEELAQIERHGYAGVPAASSIASLRSLLKLAERAGEAPKINFQSLVRAARAGLADVLCDFSSLEPADRERAAGLIESWLRVKQAQPNSAAGRPDLEPINRAAAAMMTAIGFTGVEIAESKREQHWTRIQVNADMLQRRQDCVVPAFGSEARGNYTLLIVSQASFPSCLNNLAALPAGAIVFVTAALPPKQKQVFQDRAREGILPLALIDDLAMATLAALPEAGTRAFFDMGLSWGNAAPYSDVSEYTSVEMFFGRDAELRALANRDGPCLVYGGRQLGKTALLKQIELRENMNADRVAVYCKIQRIGESDPVDALWPLIETRLGERKVKLPGQGSTIDRLRLWIDSAPARTMLIMLDEADAFLEAEMASNFPTIDRIRTLMDDTGRRLKFIFAGLHNVQRFHRAPNSPLLHLGTPINVGPLMGSDWEAARQMAIEPMAALGFEFANRSDATYMLSLVGFYPSLMQSFGKTVVEQANRRLRRKEATVPFSISRETIDSCFRDQAFRRDVVKKFRATLDLDERYELITYVLWQATQEDNLAGRYRPRGYPSSEIRRMANEWWPAGFQDTASPDAFTALLDEMAEMGVLARDRESYRLRSRRIAAMLGSEQEIEDRLQDFHLRPPSRRPDPLSSHRLVSGLWSPLPLRQEMVLKDRLLGDVKVALIGGAPATGLDDLPDALTMLATSLGWNPPRRLRPEEGVESILAVAADLRRDARPNLPRLLHIVGRWPTAEELAILLRDRSMRETERPVRLVFTAIPDQVLSAQAARTGLLTILLKPLPAETLRHWLNRVHYRFDDDKKLQSAQQALREDTGGWLQVLDAIKLPPEAQRKDLAILRERARAAAATATLADLGLHGTLLDLARMLHEYSEAEPAPAADWCELAAEWTRELEMLEALGVTEAVIDKPGWNRLNSVAARLLAAA